MSAIKPVKTWIFKGKTYRIVGRQRRETERGYTDASVERYNVLQIHIRGLFGIPFLSRWLDVEEEHVPSFVWISIGALGYSDWKSALFEKCHQELGLGPA